MPYVSKESTGMANGDGVRWVGKAMHLGADRACLYGHTRSGEASSRRAKQKVPDCLGMVPVDWIYSDDGNGFHQIYPLRGQYLQQYIYRRA